MNKLKNVLTTLCFAAFILGFSLLCLLHTSAAASEAERRPLAQMPQFSWQAVKSGKLFTQFDDYATDQFPARDFFRSVKANFQLSVLNIKENNGLAVKDGYVAKIETSLNEASLKNAAQKFTYIYQNYLAAADTNNYIAIVPDKNRYFAAKYGYPCIDYETLVADITRALPDFSYIDLFDELDLTSYYKTDTHWRQEKLAPVAAKIAAAMGTAPLSAKYEENFWQPFKGVYYGQSALNLKPDTLCYLTNDVLADCTVYDYETDTTLPVYDTAKLNGQDAYDVFMGGTKALLRLDNPHAANNKQLVVFRDSYGASLVPLLAEAYSSIVLVDIRYISPQYLDRYIEFAGQDVLLLYSTLLLNDSFAFKS